MGSLEGKAEIRNVIEIKQDGKLTKARGQREVKRRKATNYLTGIIKIKDGKWNCTFNWKDVTSWSG